MKNEPTRFKLGSFDVPLPPWAVSALAIIVVVAAGAFVYSTYIQGPIAASKGNAFSEKQLQESRKHFHEPPEKQESVFSDVRGVLTVSYYASDGCILISRKYPDPTTPVSDLFVLDSSRNATVGKSPGNVSGGTLGAGRGPRPPSLDLVASAEALGNCLNPHPGQFQYWNGQQNGCWLQVWRRWPDGCTHYQWYQTCAAVWDPQIWWTVCNH